MLQMPSLTIAWYCDADDAEQMMRSRWRQSACWPSLWWHRPDGVVKHRAV